MAFIVRGKESSPSFDASLKVLKAKDVWALKEAKEIIDDAHRQKENLIKAGLVAFLKEQHRGFREGYEKAQQEQSIHMIDIVTKTVEYFGRIEQKMVDLVLDAIQKILGELNEEEKAINIVKNALSVVRSRSEINIRVSPENSEKIKNELESLRKSFPLFTNIGIISDSNVLPDGCIVETELGKVEASLSGQIDALRQSFEKIFGGDSEDHQHSEKASSSQD